MKKVAALVALSLLMAGCVSNDKIAVTPEQLQHHRFVLESVNGCLLYTSDAADD